MRPALALVIVALSSLTATAQPAQRFAPCDPYAVGQGKRCETELEKSIDGLDRAICGMIRVTRGGYCSGRMSDTDCAEHERKVEHCRARG